MDETRRPEWGDYNFDPWDTEGDGGGESKSSYNRDERYTRATNKYNHSVEFRVRVPPALGAEIHAIVNRRVIGAYRSPADVFRDALFHHLHYLNETVMADEHLGEQVTAVQRLDRIDRFQEYMLDMSSTVSGYKDTLERAVSNNDQYTLTSLLAHAEADLMQFRDPYYDQLKGLIDHYRRFTR